MRKLYFLEQKINCDCHHAQVNHDSGPLRIVNQKESQNIKEDDIAIPSAFQIGLREHVRIDNMLDEGQNIVSGSLDAAQGNSFLGVVFRVIHIAILDIGNVKTGNVSVIAKDAKISIG